MENLDLLIDLHLDGERQGPGNDATTRQAIALSGLTPDPALSIADIGCGTGAASLLLARELGARVRAVDLLPQFLERLGQRAAAAGLSRQISLHQATMDELPFAAASLDAIWSEGAIYHIGFANGVQRWRKYLRPGGILAVSELTWLTATRPAELQAHWQQEYPEVDTAAAKLALLEQAGYSPLGYFVLPGECWLEAYYRPLQRRFAAFLASHGNTPAANATVAAENHEIALYERYREYFGYGYYIARKIGD